MSDAKDKARVAVLISGGGTNLQAIIDRWQAGDLPHAEPVLVVSSRAEAGGLARAERAGIRNLYITKDGLRNGVPDTASDGDPAMSPFERTLYALLQEERIDVIVLAGFLRVLSAAFVSQYPERILNVHPSLIPSFCGDGFYGLRVHQAALDYGVKVTGATVHYVNEVTDGGRIIAQRAVDILPDDTPETLQRRVMEQAEWILLPQAVEMVAKEIIK